MRTKAFGILLALLIIPLAGLAAKETGYFALNPQAVANYFAQAEENISCSVGTWIDGPNEGLSEHIIHRGPLGFCGEIETGTGVYHIISVSSFTKSGATSLVPQDPDYNGRDPRATNWQDLRTGKERKVTAWKDVDNNGRLSRGDLVSYNDGSTVPIEEVGTAAKIERSSDTAKD